EGLNIEFKPYGIWVCDIMVGFVDTPMVRNAAHKAASVEEMGVNVEPDQVAETVWRATEEEKVHHFVDVAATSFMAHLEGLPCDDRGA
ncbi:hypothetical protein RNM29_33210, partial [Pseudomonas aeruginosa]|nr:hypothetical protein [Pseudomonas aeruginosa]